LKLILLPGMDGTGELFDPLLPYLTEYECTVIHFPIAGDQDYPTLTNYVRTELPDDDFLIIAESFSGPIAATLAAENTPHLKAIIFVATFLSSPGRWRLLMSRLLPLEFLGSLPFADRVMRVLFFDRQTSDETFRRFMAIARKLPTSLIKSRFKAMQDFSLELSKTNFPAAYLQSSSDRLVPSGKSLEFEQYFENIVFKKIDGPHFLLQSNPKESAAAISELMLLLKQC